MPFIHIKSLPLRESLDVPHIIKGITQDFAEKTNIDLLHVHTTWEFYKPGYYAKGGKTANFQPDTNYPIIVDLLTPDFNDATSITLMLETIAQSIATRAEFPKNNIFINHRQAHSCYGV